MTSDLVYEIQLSRKSKPKLVHADNLKICPVDPVGEDLPRNWMTESEIIGEGPMNSVDEERPQEVDECQEEGQGRGSDMKAEEETQVDTSREDPSLPSVEVPIGRG